MKNVYVRRRELMSMCRQSSAKPIDSSAVQVPNAVGVGVAPLHVSADRKVSNDPNTSSGSLFSWEMPPTYDLT